jgi:serine phosphatase RsbU (regulator of sigma subunit)
VELSDGSRSAAIGARTLAAVGGHLGPGGDASDGDDSALAAWPAASGRGLLIVASLAATVGETIEQDGKTVWFELDARRSAGAGPAVIVQQPARPAVDGNGAAAGAAPAAGRAATVRLVDVPVGVAVAGDDHLSDLVRELALDPAAPLAERLLPALDDLGGCFPYDADWRERLRAARVFGNPRLDIEISADLDRLAGLRRVAHLLDEADDAMRANRLLVLPAPLAVRRFRRWAVEEVAAQLAGAPPSAPPAAVMAAAPPVDGAGRDPEADDDGFFDPGDPVHLIARLRRELQARKQLLDERAHLAETLQASLLPPELPVIQGLAVAGRYRAGTADVGGDFYDVFPLRGRTWGFIIGDVCGKGPAAAAKTALARYTLRTAAMLERRPADVLPVLNDALLQRGEPESFCSALFARLRPGQGGASGELFVAGHPRPLLRRRSGHVERLPTGGALLGILDGDVTRRVSLRLDPGDVLLVYTDGVTEARGDGKLFGENRLVETLARAGPSVDDVAAAVERAVLAFRDDDRADDVAVLAISPPA